MVKFSMNDAMNFARIIKVGVPAKATGTPLTSLEKYYLICFYKVKNYFFKIQTWVYLDQFHAYSQDQQ